MTDRQPDFYPGEEVDFTFSFYFPMVVVCDFFGKSQAKTKSICGLKFSEQFKNMFTVSHIESNSIINNFPSYIIIIVIPVLQ